MLDFCGYIAGTLVVNELYYHNFKLFGVDVDGEWKILKILFGRTAIFQELLWQC